VYWDYGSWTFQLVVRGSIDVDARDGDMKWPNSQPLQPAPVASLVLLLRTAVIASAWFSVLRQGVSI
jgi:hypothetical protein